MTNVTSPMFTTVEELFESEADRIFGFVVARCGDAEVAEDITAETLLAADGRFRAGAGREVTRSWLLTVARRRLIDHWRRKASASRALPKLATDTRDLEPADTDPDGHVESALESLSSRQRGALMLRYVDGFSTADVAEAMGLSYRAAESLLARARRAFQTAYEVEVSDGR